MKRLHLICTFLITSSATASNGPYVLSNSDHAASMINAAITTFLGAGVVDVSILTDETSTTNGPFISSLDFVSAARDIGRTNFKISNNSFTRNNAPYGVITQSSTGYSDALDLQLYSSLYNAGVNSVIYNWPMVFPAQGNVAPPVILTNIIAPPSTNPNNGGGSGTEFAMSAGYKGLSTSTSSDTTAGFAGLLASVWNQHSNWNQWDLKGAFRQTSSKWPVWNHDYGNIDADAANMLGSTSSLYLQPPRITATSPAKNTISIIDYPFRQSRRHHEEVYLFPSGYSWPVKNELVTADIIAASGTLIYSSNTTDVIPTATVSFSVPPGAYDLIAFTADNAGHFSAVQLFSAIPVVGSCL